MVDSLAVGAFVLQFALVGALVEAIRRRNVAALVNTLVALSIALLPWLLASAIPDPPRFSSAVTVWLAAAGFLHSVGMLGLYESTWWWDHVTHTVSAALVAALVYAGLTVTLGQSVGGPLSANGVAAATVIFTLFVGVFWELVELVARDVGERIDVQPMLVHYGWRDTALDLVFDVVGALLVVGLELHLFVPIAGRFPATTGLLVFGSGSVVVLGSLIMALSVRSGNAT